MAAGNSSVVGLLRVILSMDTAEFDKAAKRAGGRADALSKEFNRVGKQMASVGATLTKAITLPLVGLAAASSKAAIDFESSFANVDKTVDGVSDSSGRLTEAGQKLAITFRQMAKEIPATTDELNAIAALGGQMGVPIDQLEKFTFHVAALGTAVDGISTEDAAAGLAKIGTAVGKGTTQIAEMASSLVHLGNSSNATESDILEFTKRLIGAGNSVGMTVPEVMALGTAMANVGIKAEAGGTAMSQIIQKISVAVSKGGEKLDAFAKLAGKSAAEFASMWKRSPAEAIDLIVKGLSRMRASGVDLNLTMSELGTTGIRQASTMKLLAGAGDGVAVSMKIANEGFAAANKHLEEASKKWATTEKQLTMLWSRIKDVGITLGNALLPAINSTIGAVTNLLPAIDSLAKVFAALPGWMQLGVIGLGALLAAIGPVVFVMGQMAMATSSLIGLFGKKGIATRLLAADYAALATSAKGVAAGIGLATVAVTGGIVAASKLSDATHEAVKRSRDGEATWRDLPAILGNAISRGLFPFFEMWNDIGDAVTKVREVWASATRVLSEQIPVLSSVREVLNDVGRILTSAFVIGWETAKLAVQSAREEVERVFKALSFVARAITGSIVTQIRDFANGWMNVANVLMRMVRPQFEALLTFLYRSLPAGLQFGIAAVKAIASKIPGAAEIKKLANELDFAARVMIGLGKRGHEAATEAGKAGPAIVAIGTAAGAAAPPVLSFVRRLAEARSAIAALTSEQRANIDAGIKLGESSKKIAEAVNAMGGGAKITAGIIDLYKESLKGVSKQHKDASKAAAEHAKELERLDSALERAGLLTDTGFNRRMSELVEVVNHAAKQGTPALRTALKTLAPAFAEVEARAIATGKNVGVAMGIFNEALVKAGIIIEALRQMEAGIPTASLDDLIAGLKSISVESQFAAVDARALEDAYKRFGISTQAQLDAVARQAEHDYARIAAAVGQHAPEARIAYEKMVEAQKAATRTLPSVWQKEIFPRIKDVIGHIQTAISGSFAQMLLGAKGFKDGFLDIWASIKAGLVNILNSILSYFTDSFLKGLIGALSGQQGAFGKAFAGLFGGIGIPGLGGGAGAAGVGTTVPLVGPPGAAGAAGGAGAAAGVAGGAAAGGAGVGLGILGQKIFGGAGAKAGLFGGGSGALTGALIGSIVPGLGTAMGALIGGLGGLLGGLIGKSIGEKANDFRDDFLPKLAEQFGLTGTAGTGIGSTFHNIAAELTKATGEAGGGRMFKALTDADTPEKAKQAIEAIAVALTKYREETDKTVASTKTLDEQMKALVAGMKPDEFKALSEGYREALSEGFTGSLEDFARQQLMFYQTLEEGDARLKTFFYGNTIDAFNRIAASGGDAAKQIAADFKAMGDEIRASMKSLDDELAAIDKSEAPEAVMGTIEKRARERIARQKSDLQKELDAIEAAAKKTVEEVTDTNAGAVTDMRKRTQDEIDFMARTAGMTFEEMLAEWQKTFGGMVAISGDATNEVIADAKRMGQALKDALNTGPLAGNVRIDMPLPTKLPSFQFGTPNLEPVDFGATGKLALLHNRETVVPESREAEFAAKHSAVGSQEAVALLRSIDAGIRSGRAVSVQVDGRELVQAQVGTIKANTGGTRTEMREALGVR